VLVSFRENQIAKMAGFEKADIKDQHTLCIPENGEYEFKGDPVEETIQTQYEENWNMIIERLSEKHAGDMQNVPAMEISRAVQVLFKLNNLTSVSGHSEDEVLTRHWQAKNLKKRRTV
jgi:hypothetical protein